MINNKVGGLIAADGRDATAIFVFDDALHLTNAGTIRGTGAVDDHMTYAGAIQSVEGDDVIRNTGSIIGSIQLSAGNDTIENYGSIIGDISLDSGDDSYTQWIGATLTGTVDGGSGDNTLIIDVTGGGAYRSPNYVNFSNFRQIGTGTVTYDTSARFENFEISSGELRLVPGASLTSQGLFAITGGRVVGEAGSVFSAGQFVVGSGGTFGSAGTVNGDVAVSGTLSPGASPGTMTINGNVSLASGSNTLFEMTPTVSDAIAIDGALNIAAGATLTLTGKRPPTPGTAYDLITASKGVTGSFSTIDKAATVFGFIRQSADSIQLLGQFLLDADGARDLQASRVTDYLNGLLIGGAATAGIIDVVPDLIDANGFGDAGKLRRLSPEAYASASQIGVENGLALAAAGRTMNMANGRAKAGFFTFGQSLGNWRHMPGRESLGTSKADINTHGIVGGIGYGSQVASVGAFIGYIDAKQRIGGLGATTDSDGMVAGVIGQAKLGGLEIAVTGAFDGSKADTRRALPDGSTASSHYDMRGWTVDASLGYAVDIGQGWSLKPEVGITHIESKRDGAIEAGGSPLALVVNGHTARATYVSGQMTVRGDPEDRIQPWLSAGVRHQTDGNVQIASAAFTGATAMLAVPGAPRDKTQATVSVGLTAAISPMASLFFGLSSEFGADTSGQTANAGLKLRF
jgi:uncharacterized protein with beta-barrel porin domain